MVSLRQLEVFLAYLLDCNLCHYSLRIGCRQVVGNKILLKRKEKKRKEKGLAALANFFKENGAFINTVFKEVKKSVFHTFKRIKLSGWTAE